MPTRIDFRDCVHHGIAGPTPAHILASIRAEYCLPPGSPAQASQGAPQGARAKAVLLQPEDFPALARALGADAFRQLLGDFHRRPDQAGGGLRDLPEFLAQHRYGRATPALLDLARLERTLAASERAPETRSIGACCLPPALLRGHPGLTLAFHPAWHWLQLESPADAWREALLGDLGDGAPPLPRATRLRLAPEQGRSGAQRLSPDSFAFERALQAGLDLQRAVRAAATFTPGFDGVAALQPLLMAGAVIDVDLHPAPEPRDPDEIQPRKVMP